MSEYRCEHGTEEQNFPCPECSTTGATGAMMPGSESEYVPRAPTDAEKDEIAAALARNWTGPATEDYEDVRAGTRADLDFSYVAVFERYATGAPGYVGPVVFVVFDGGPSMHYVLAKDNEQRAFDLVKYEGCMCLSG